jgi:hypothetical protein
MFMGNKMPLRVPSVAAHPVNTGLYARRRQLSGVMMGVDYVIDQLLESGGTSVNFSIR